MFYIVYTTTRRKAKLTARPNPKNRPANIRLDSHTAALLERLAVEHEGNKSATIRKLIRQAAQRLLPAPEPPGHR